MRLPHKLKAAVMRISQSAIEAQVMVPPLARSPELLEWLCRPRRDGDPIFTRGPFASNPDTAKRYIEAKARLSLRSSSPRLSAPNGNPQPAPKFTHSLP